MASPQANLPARGDIESASDRRRSALRCACSCVSMFGSLLAALGVAAIIVAFLSMRNTTLPRFAFQSLPIVVGNQTDTFASPATVNVGNPNGCSFQGVEVQYNVSYSDHVLGAVTTSPTDLGPHSVVSVAAPVTLYDIERAVHEQLVQERDDGNEVVFDVAMQVKASTDAPHIKLNLRNFYVTCRVHVSNLTVGSEVTYTACNSHY